MNTPDWKMDWKRNAAPHVGNRRILLERMDKAFGIFSQESEKLSVLLAAEPDPSSWTLYHDLIRQKTVELVAYEKYRKIQEELFSLIEPPKPELRHESSVS
jgi:hypothetical protein